jgi:glycosyltransferase involved in cell wall biosynthesis
VDGVSQRDRLVSVLISHPHVAAFAHGMAGALEAEGRLAAFMTGVAFSDAGWSGRAAGVLTARWPVLRNRIVSDVPARRLRNLGVVELGARGAARALMRAGVRTKPYDALFTAHDLAVSLMPWPSETTAVYAYEDGALATFRRAQRAGLARIWDLPLPHYATIEAMHRAEAARWPEAVAGPVPVEPVWKRTRKDAELALATTVAVASAFTRRSLEAIDVRTPTAVVPYGYPVAEFSPRPSPPTGPFTVLAVGSHDLRKGTPYLLEAWRRAELRDAELHLVGPMRLAPAFVARYAGLFKHWPHLPKSALGARYAAADLVAFPTLGDGFGLVIQEAMCSATPVLTTPCGGGPECITDGVDGWLIPPRDIDALVARLREAAASRDRLFAMGQAALRRAEQWTWRDAGRALLRALPSA